MANANFDNLPFSNVYIDRDIVDAHFFINALKPQNQNKERIFHLFSHGRPGELLINGKWRNAHEISDWFQKNGHLRNVSRINIYGCNFAKGTKGHVAVTYLKTVLGVPVGASNNLTGKNGDWYLEAGAPYKTSGMEDYPFDLQDTDNDGVPDIADLDDDNDGIPDLEECPGNIYVVGITTPIQSIPPVWTGGTSTQLVDLSAAGLPIGTTVVISNIVVSGDLNSSAEFFALDFNSGEFNTGLVQTGLQCNRPFLDPLTTPITTAVTVIDIGSGTPGIRIDGIITSTSVGNFCFPNRDAVRYQLDIDIPCADNDGDGIENYLDLDSDGDGCNDVVEAGFTDGDNDGVLGSSPITVNSYGLVNNAPDGYTLPVDVNGNTVFDFLEVGVLPNIITQPINTRIIIGEDAILSTLATGTTNRYQWQVSTDNGNNYSNISDGSEYIGTNSTTLTITAPRINKNGYLFRAIVTDNAFTCGDVISSTAHLSIGPRTVITNRGITTRVRVN